MEELFGTGWIGWAIAIAVGVPVILVVLTELLGWLTRRGSAAAKPVRLLRNWVIPVAALLGLLVFANRSPAEFVWARVVATVLGFLVILLVLSALNVALFANAKPGSWRERIPSIFVDLGRLVLIVVGLAILFSWVWDADVGGLIAALGVTSIVIGLALQNAVGGIISGLLLLFEQPFKLGDWLDTGSVRGRVVEVNWRAVHIDTGQGVQVVPNSALAGASFTNLSLPTELHRAGATVTFSTDDPPNEVIELLVDVANGLPMRMPQVAPTARYLGAAKYEVEVPVAGPAAADSAVSLLLAWLWYAARRRGLSLDGDATDPVAEPDRLAAALEQVAPMFRLGDDDRARFAPSCRLERYGTGEVVQQPDRVPDMLRVVVDGGLRLSVVTDRGAIDSGTAGVGDFVGQTVLTREPSFVRAVAGEVTTMLVMPLEVIDEIVHANPAVARDIGQAIENRRRAAADALAAAGIVKAALGRP
ncbi:mechanosensitive ion channel domain-containing protein [Agromyces italicus]|uniref:mechanosensitive ion channel domain-containing protein n=1 Tax=Agromyces italicus TaxID=279572 RepID=UPI0003B3F4E1|nr:mechanosensitive ion channel domain-containing protein [Agromyces italicus]